MGVYILFRGEIHERGTRNRGMKEKLNVCKDRKLTLKVGILKGGNKRPRVKFLVFTVLWSLIFSILDPESQRAETFGGSRSSNKVSAPAPDSKSYGFGSETGVPNLNLIYHENII